MCLARIAHLFIEPPEALHISTVGLVSKAWGGEEGGGGEFKLLSYLFHASNSINDFIDPALSRILSHSQANEMGNQAISWHWWLCSGFSLSNVQQKSHLSLPAACLQLQERRLRAAATETWVRYSHHSYG